MNLLSISKLKTTFDFLMQLNINIIILIGAIINI